MTGRHAPPPRVASLKTVAAFRAHLGGLPIPTECDEALLPAAENPLAQGAEIGGRRVGNRFTVQPMEGWDGTPDGKPSDLTVRRWRHFGRSGAKLVWGGEAVAIRHEGRANPISSPSPRPAAARWPGCSRRSRRSTGSGTARPTTW